MNDRTSDATVTHKRQWRETLLQEGATIGDAIRNLDESNQQIVLLVNANEELLGTLTDGDIRRGLLRGLGLESPVEPIVFRSPLVAPPDLDRDMALQIMQANKIRQLPVVNDARTVVGLHLMDELLSPGCRSNLMIFMAGGQGTRLRPHTQNCPKPLLPVGGKPMLEHSIEQAKANGFSRFVISVHYLGHMIEEHFGDGGQLGVSIEYLREDEPLGTAGALGLLNNRPELPFVVSNGDVLTDIHYGELLDFHNRHQAVATMAVRQHEWQHPFGVVRIDGVDIVGFDEKPVTRSHINAGIYVLSPEALDCLPQGEHCDMPALFAQVQRSDGRAVVYPMHEPWLDVGREGDLKQARSDRQAGAPVND